LSINISPIKVDNNSATDLFCILLTSIIELGMPNYKEFTSGQNVSNLCTQILAYDLSINGGADSHLRIMAATLKKDAVSENNRVPDKKGMLVGFCATSSINGISQIKYIAILERFRGKKIASTIIQKSCANSFPIIAGISNELAPFYQRNKFKISAGKDNSWKVAHRNLAPFNGSVTRSIEVDTHSDAFMEAAVFLNDNLSPLAQIGKGAMRDWNGWNTYFTLVKKIGFTYPLLQNNLRYGQKDGPITIST
jgi:hypothetical protein